MTLWTLAPVLLEQVRNYCRHPRYTLMFIVGNGDDIDYISVKVLDTKSDFMAQRVLYPSDVAGKTSEESYALELAMKIRQELRNGR